ncbi:phage/plasmid primase, P4 family [Herbaspirillum sp. YR522]|uniref:DNA primase family protein n=1 Tax=Herbaspirillum sp. YR522 TaxID=1144342 RepID=UPI00026F6569|nr:DNA primase family protein [Herbaspirillum sp. YR522]EJM98574.1 phage/plasmid primase, P4 family containing protein [Herbaspirillum sp. YR522]
MSTNVPVKQEEATLLRSNGEQDAFADVLDTAAATLAEQGLPVGARVRQHALLPLQLLKCRTLRICCSGEAACSNHNVLTAAAKQLGRYAGIQDFTTSKGLATLGSAIATADTTRPPSCEEIRENGATTCPSGGCPLPGGSIAESPEDLLQWNCAHKDIGHVTLARSVVASEFGSGLLVAPGDKMYAPHEGAYQPIDTRKIQNLIIKHLGADATIKRADAIRKMILAIELTDAEAQPSPNHICFTNGTLDVTTGRLGEHNIAHSLFNRIPHSYVSGSQCPNFMAFLHSIWSGDVDTVEKHQFIQQWMGYMLTANISQQCMLILKGEGSNGKSVLMDIARHIVGEENTTSAMLHRLNHPDVRATLEKKLLNQSPDLPKLRHVADGEFKAIVGGDSIEASAKYKPSSKFKPYVKLMTATNSMPHSADTTEGYFRRIIVLTFNRQFSASERDPKLLDKLKEETPGIISWAVAGARALQALGRFSIPPSSDQEVRAYRTELSPARGFAEECLVPSQGLSGIKAQELFSAYSSWCRSHHFSAGNSISFGRELSRLSFRSRKVGSTVWMVSPSEAGRPYFPNNIASLPGTHRQPAQVM